MSTISKLNIDSLRNILQASLQLSPGINLLHGENGSGKTTVLESIQLLASGQSFRTSKLDSLINDDRTTAVVFAEVASDHKIGLSRTRRQGHQLHLDGEKQRNWDNVARQLPVQVLDTSSFLLLEGGPKMRRRFLDWGVFHVEPLFVENWRKTRKCLANRNLLLKQSTTDRDQLRAWDSELCLAAKAVDCARALYFERFVPIFNRVYESLAKSEVGPLSLTYSRGWDAEKELSDVLLENRHTDIKYGATQNGPHRADVIVKSGIRLAMETLSRGQQKILVSTLKIAQGMLLTEALERHCIYLVDDLPAELDRRNREKVLKELIALKGQLFVTCVEREALQIPCQVRPEMAVFHVERGTITA
ncbi:MAG: DNA replication/repair protein RecF [Proteobacteria bacterium]|nr:DNA replication/repair protein RecF [Pseudomonadota bacterium]